MECFPFLIQQQTKRSKEQRGATQSPREVGRNVSLARLQMPPGVGWNSCCYYEHAPTEEKRDKASTLCLAPGISDTDGLQAEALGPPRHEKWRLYGEGLRSLGVCSRYWLWLINEHFPNSDL